MQNECLGFAVRVCVCETTCRTTITDSDAPHNKEHGDIGQSTWKLHAHHIASHNCLWTCISELASTRGQHLFVFRRGTKFPGRANNHHPGTQNALSIRLLSTLTQPNRLFVVFWTLYSQFFALIFNAASMTRWETLRHPRSQPSPATNQPDLCLRYHHLPIVQHSVLRFVDYFIHTIWHSSPKICIPSQPSGNHAPFAYNITNN